MAFNTIIYLSSLQITTTKYYYILLLISLDILIDSTIGNKIQFNYYHNITKESYV